MKAIEYLKKQIRKLLKGLYLINDTDEEIKELEEWIRKQ